MKRQGETVFIYRCQDSLESIFTAIYNVYEDKRDVSETRLSLTDEPMLFATDIPVEEDIDKVHKVIRSLKRYFGEDNYLHICYALSSSSPQKAQAVFGTIAAGLTHRRSERGDQRHKMTADIGAQMHHSARPGSDSQQGHLFDNLADDSIHLAFTLGKAAANEHHLLLGFLRFQELEDGILFAKIGPKNNIMTFLMPHFADRLPGENFVVYDDGRNFFGVHPAGKAWYLVDGQVEGESETGDGARSQTMHRTADYAMEGLSDGFESRWSKEEREYQELFRSFCHRIAIKERKNLKCQRNMLPLRFQEYMLEFHTFSQNHHLNV
jgi:probable DNA metabolism protein